MKAALTNKPALFQFGAAFLLHSRKSFFHSGKNASTASTHNGNFPITKAQFIASLSIHTCGCLRREGLLLLGDVMDRSERDARFALPTEETVNMLMEIGWYFYEGKAELEDGTTVDLDPDPELSFKAFHYAEQFGDSYGREMKKRVLHEFRK